jgi:hypothetical protein
MRGQHGGAGPCTRQTLHTWGGSLSLSLVEGLPARALSLSLSLCLSLSLSLSLSSVEGRGRHEGAAHRGVAELLSL